LILLLQNLTQGYTITIEIYPTVSPTRLIGVLLEKLLNFLSITPKSGTVL